MRTHVSECFRALVSSMSIFRQAGRMVSQNFGNDPNISRSNRMEAMDLPDLAPVAPARHRKRKGRGDGAEVRTRIPWHTSNVFSVNRAPQCQKAIGGTRSRWVDGLKGSRASLDLVNELEACCLEEVAPLRGLDRDARAPAIGIGYGRRP